MSFDYKDYIDLRGKPIRIVIDTVDFTNDLIYCEDYDGLQVTDFGSNNHEKRRGWHCLGIRIGNDWQCAIITHDLLTVEEKGNESD